MKVSWKSIAPIFATVAISPWNLLVGGLLIQHLSFLQTIVSLGVGYGILGLVFVLYGGLGYKEKKQSSEILSEIFPSSFVRYLIPLILAAGQIGWAGINFELGGKSLATLLSVAPIVGIALYGIAMMVWGMLNIKLLGLSKWLVVASSIGLIGWVLINKMYTFHSASLLTHIPQSSYSVFWGISVVVASFISFATVSPDFFKDVKKKKDILFSTMLGIIIPGALTAGVGALLFFDRPNFDLVALISATSFFFFPHIFNVVTNTDGAIATYVAGLKFENFAISYKKGIVIAGIISVLLAVLGITAHLSLWLSFLSLFFPAFIGVCVPALVFKRLFRKRLYYQEVLIAFSFALFFGAFLLNFFPPVLISLLTPLVVFSIFLSYTNISLFNF